MNDITSMKRKAEAKLDEIRAEIDKLDAKVSQAKADQQAKLRAEMADLSEKRDNFEDKLAQLEEDSEVAMTNVKLGLEMAWKDVESALDRARKQFE